MEFYDVQFSYIRLSNMEEMFVPVPSRAAASYPGRRWQAHYVYTVANGTNGMKGLFKFETTR